MITALAFFTLAAGPGFHGEITERLSTPPSFTLTTAKTIEQLEFCVADMVSNLGAPAAFRAGPSRTVIVASSMKIQGAVDLRREGNVTSLTGYFRGHADDRMRAALTSCL